jgi:hypothetical protein
MMVKLLQEYKKGLQSSYVSVHSDLRLQFSFLFLSASERPIALTFFFEKDPQ